MPWVPRLYTIRHIPRSDKPGTPLTERGGGIHSLVVLSGTLGGSGLLGSRGSSQTGDRRPTTPRLPPRSLSNYKSGSTEITHLRYMTRTSSMLKCAYRRAGRPSSPLRGRRPGFATGYTGPSGPELCQLRRTPSWRSSENLPSPTFAE
jgi:hypothetical protein